MLAGLHFQWHWGPALAPAPPARLIELKPSSQDPSGEDRCPNNKGAQRAIYWGELWGPKLEHKLSLEPRGNLPEGEGVRSHTHTLEPERLPSCQGRPSTEDLWRTDTQQGNFAGTQQQPTEVTGNGAQSCGATNSELHLQPCQRSPELVHNIL
jgi:hypothetical protein